MAQVTFSGDPRSPGTDPATAVFHGVTFPLGKPAEVSEDVARKLATHSHFTVHGNLGDFDGNGEPGGSVVAVTGLKAVHKGRGRFVITDGSTILKEGLDKAAAAKFNALDDAGKAAAVAE